MTFPKLLVQPPHHRVTCAHDKSSFKWILTFTNEENIDQPIITSEITQRCISWTFNWKAYRQRTTQEWQILTMDEQPENDQGQQMRGRRGVRTHGGRVKRQNRGRCRRGQEQRRISDEIKATEALIRWNKGHCCGPCCRSWLTMAEECS